MKYKVGQKVRVRRELKAGFDYGGIYFNTAMELLRGEVATIKGDVNNGDYYRLNELPWTWSGEMFEPACIEKIVITSDGVTTTARKYDGKKLIKEAKAVCSKDDVFNFEVGANLAMERLLGGGIPEKSLYNGRVICTNNNGSPLYVTGKIYEFVNGELTENGAPLCCAPKDVIIRTLRDWQRHSMAEWLEVVE